MRILKIISCSFAIAVLTLGCATVVPPDGGPEDKSPPRILAIYPAPQSTHNSTQLTVMVQFDEWIIDPVPKGAVRISPPLAGRMLTEVKGNSLRISATEPLDSATTYTAVISNAIKDLRNNPLAEPFTILFSTGAAIDTLSVAGWVKIPDSAAVRKNFPMVGLYPVGTQRQHKGYLLRLDSLADALEPRLDIEPAMLITQADSTGYFQISGVAPGQFRLAAFFDNNRNSKIDLSQELAGVGFSDLTLDQTPLDSLFLLLGSQDTTSLALDEVKQQLGFFINLRFNQVIPTASLDSIVATCGIYGRDSSLSLAPVAWWPTGDSSQINLAFNHEFSSDSTYWVGCQPQDLHKLAWLTPTDTARTTLSRVFLADHSPALDSLPLVIGAYNQPIAADTILPRLRAVFNKDTIAVQGQQRYANSWELRPTRSLPKNAKITLIEGQTDTIVRDSLSQITTTWKAIGSFETANPLELVNFSGSIKDCNSQTVVRLYSIKNRQYYTVKCTTPEQFVFTNMLAGAYFMDYFLDEDGDNRPFAGSIVPYRAAEAWRSVADTIFITKDPAEPLNKSIYPALPTRSTP